MVTQRTVRQVRRVMLWALTALLVVIALGIATSTWRVFGTMASVRAERYEAEREREALRLRTAELQAAVSALDTPRGLEAEIRSRYPLVKPGEQEFIFVDRATQEPAVELTTKKSVRDRVIETLTNAWEALILPLN